MTGPWIADGSHNIIVKDKPVTSPGKCGVGDQCYSTCDEEVEVHVTTNKRRAVRHSVIHHAIHKPKRRKKPQFTIKDEARKYDSVK